MFSARLRLDASVTEAQVREYVDEVIGIVELQPVQNKMVGMPKISGLSVEQRKRLTIAVELVANPSVVFMDEPTSGEPLMYIYMIKYTCISSVYIYIYIHMCVYNHTS